MSITVTPAPVVLEIAEGDELLTVPAALERLTGTRPHPTTTCRYCLRGSYGIVLPSIVSGGRRMTTLAAARQWMQDVTVARNAR